ncbi:MAG: aminotransferase class V-fold PLP-dependent enzyme, partial [Clostridium sp.]|nr:aminotransferase class V-fold PLP-dependent enzyme [Clostridium sp.]
MNINELRTLFPVTQNYVFLNNAAESPLNLRGRQAMDDYLDLCQTAPQSKPSVRSQIRSQLADLFGGQPDEYALVTSTGLGISMVAAGYQWAAGDNVVVPSNEHWNNSFPWQALIEKGVEVRFVQPDEDHRMNPAQVAALTDQNTKIVAVAAVSFNTGFRSDLKKLAAIVHA